MVWFRGARRYADVVAEDRNVVINRRGSGLVSAFYFLDLGSKGGLLYRKHFMAV